MGWSRQEPQSQSALVQVGPSTWGTLPSIPAHPSQPLVQLGLRFLPEETCCFWTLPSASQLVIDPSVFPLTSTLTHSHS